MVILSGFNTFVLHRMEIGAYIAVNDVTDRGSVRPVLSCSFP